MNRSVLISHLFIGKVVKDIENYRLISLLSSYVTQTSEQPDFRSRMDHIQTLRGQMIPKTSWVSSLIS